MYRLFTTLLVLFITVSSLGQTDYKLQRAHMVEKQLKNRGITDRPTLQAMSRVPRHEFVPDRLKGDAYDDGPLPIGEGQTISQPYIVAFMTQSLNLKPSDKVLEIGTGSGYQAAVLAEIVDSVYTIEIVEKLGHRAEDLLQRLEYSNVYVKVGDGYGGWPEKAPFDAIIVTAGAEEVPPPLLEQLNEGGRLIIPKGAQGSVQQLILATKSKNKIKTEKLLPVRFVPFTRDQD
ncbi:protein-L-isoaspartate(D-aspartate) O-methyltransferase [Pricia sp. S334]|uniref:Protein-L-isoaspartate O-methyltransferase n=1 Tax=Pricia mediterranea TaxID=3076079 RepID=A0ABU3L817_9FLAO|nr:protein-L-isoaspartate(D-aspartate) O-methyltransferase [Pricia sp. S334]MDT7829456.1 protein-L-isoaspartate(D-aspartate) O-methyltransferase [Pricia sp. S334]